MAKETSKRKLKTVEKVRTVSEYEKEYSEQLRAIGVTTFPEYSDASSYGRQFKKCTLLEHDGYIFSSSSKS